MKDECNKSVIKNVIALKPKTYYIECLDGSNKSTLKGIKK